jgi:hypothetical protein
VPPPQGEGFLSRWSRLKREPDPVPGPAEPAPPVTAEPALPEGKTVEDLIAELPKLEDLVPGQSLAAFMQPWVPAPLRNAALQRMWLLDPAIRDYVSPALDYAYDYNTPGAAPGFGPIETTKDMVREVAELFDKALERANPDRDPQPGNDKLSQDDVPRHAALQQGTQRSSVSDERANEEAATEGGASEETRPEGVAAVHNKASPVKPLAAAKRRNGSALPS